MDSWTHGNSSLKLKIVYTEETRLSGENCSRVGSKLLIFAGSAGNDVRALPGRDSARQTTHLVCLV
jgi:hypothetical protein